VTKPFYPLASSTWDKNEYDALQRVIDSGNFTMGQEVKLFESEFATKMGASHAVMFNSGSSANLALIAALKYMQNSPLTDGDSVIVPAVSWSTTYYPIHQLGFTLSFVDIDSKTLNIDINKVRESITKKTKAIFTVNLLGNPSDLIALRKIAEEFNLLLLEDNCESLGATIEGKQAGTFGVGGTYSSFFSHHISTMEGGLVVTDSLVLEQTLRSLRALGWTQDLPVHNFVFPKSGVEWEDQFRFVLPGYNFRPLELEGALGRTQLEKLDEFISHRRENAHYLKRFAHRFPSIHLQEEFGSSSWFGFSLLLSNSLVGKRQLLIQELDYAEIQSRPIVAGNFTRNPVMKHLRHDPIGDLPGADHIHENGLFVGNHHYDISIQLDRLAEILERFERENE
jgi:CDP-6-deoxy-D-xylo-4-hexulose-3-dehydrase